MSVLRETNVLTYWQRKGLRDDAYPATHPPLLPISAERIKKHNYKNGRTGGRLPNMEDNTRDDPQ
jgi:hypothetical protein